MSPSLAQTVTDLPVWVQILATAIGLAFAAFGYLSANMKQLSPKISSDVIVPQMTIADSQALRDLAEEMKRWAVERQGRRNHELDMIIEMRKLNDGVSEINTRLIENEVMHRQENRRTRLTRGST